MTTILERIKEAKNTKENRQKCIFEDKYKCMSKKKIKWLNRILDEPEKRKVEHPLNNDDYQAFQVNKRGRKIVIVGYDDTISRLSIHHLQKDANIIAYRQEKWD